MGMESIIRSGFGISLQAPCTGGRGEGGRKGTEGGQRTVLQTSYTQYEYNRPIAVRVD